MIRMLLLLFCVCSSVVLAVDSATGSFSVQLTRRNAQAAVGAPLLVTVSVLATEQSEGWQISGSTLSEADCFLRVRPSSSRASTAGRPDALVPEGHAGIHDIPAWVQVGDSPLKVDLDLQTLFVDVLMARADFSPVLMPGDYDVMYEAQVSIRRMPTPAVPKPVEQRVALTSNEFTISILPPTAADLAWCLTTVNDSAAKPTDLRRAMMIARAAPVAHRRAVLESTLSDPWYRTMALLRLAGDRPDPSFASSVVPWLENDDEQVAACALAALEACDPAQALVVARQIGPQMRPGNFRIACGIFHKYGVIGDIPVLEAMRLRVPEPSETEAEFAGFDVKQADRDMFTHAIDAIKARAAGK